MQSGKHQAQSTRDQKTHLYSFFLNSRVNCKAWACGPICNSNTKASINVVFLIFASLHNSVEKYVKTFQQEFWQSNNVRQTAYTRITEELIENKIIQNLGLCRFLSGWNWEELKQTKRCTNRLKQDNKWYPSGKILGILWFTPPAD